MFNRDCRLPARHSFFLFGPRQTGKTTLINAHLRGGEVFSVNLLEEDIYLAYQKDPARLRAEVLKKMSAGIQTVFIDEIQRVPALLNEIQGLIDARKCQFILTGSSARKLKRGAANLLGGRAFTRELFPLTAGELGTRFDLDDVLRYGSLPPVIDMSADDRVDLLKAYTKTYLREEIQAEALVRNLGGFARFLETAAAQCGEIVSFSATGRDAGLSTSTVQSYYEILEDTLIAYKIEAWRKSVRKQLIAHPRFYFFDTGVTNALTGRLRAEPDPVMRGRLFEQWVILETKRVLANAGSELKMAYWRTNHGGEVDLVLADASGIIAGIEVKSSLKITNADVSGLASLKEDYPQAKMIVVTRLKHPFDVSFATALPVQDYLQWLKTLG